MVVRGDVPSNPSIELLHYACNPPHLPCFAHNSSTDGTASIAAARGARFVSVEKRVFAAARNGSARAAGGVEGLPAAMQPTFRAFRLHVPAARAADRARFCPARYAWRRS